MLLTKKTKIVATLGPATENPEVLKSMMLAGVDVFRVNFSHADYADVKARIDMIRALNEELGLHVSILADLQGPKLRVGVMEEGSVVAPGDEVTFMTGAPFVGDKTKAYMTYKQFPQDVKPGEKVLVDDGKLMFEVVSSNGVDSVLTKVVQGGPFKSKKGVNLPNTNVSLPALTEKDIEDAVFAIEQQVDWIALSFVRHSQDIMDLQNLIKEHSSYKIPIVAKIEKPEAIENIDQIIAYCDGLMVARGDLGVEIPAHEVPLIQKQLVRKCKQARIPVIIATQMMETMIESLTPTRAEVNDVANSVMDGADAVMLSGETSVGKYPVQVIETMSRILRSVEDADSIQVPAEAPSVKTKRFVTKSVCYHAVVMAKDIEAKSLQLLTNSGFTAYQVSACRPSCHILVFTSNKRILTQLNLLWGVKAFYYDKRESTDQTIADLNQIGKDQGILQAGDYTITLTSMPLKEKGMVNSLKVTEII